MAVDVRIPPHCHVRYFVHQVEVTPLDLDLLAHLVGGQSALAKATPHVVRQTATLQDVLALNDRWLKCVSLAFDA